MDSETLLFCDHCDKAGHMACVGLSVKPEGEWACPDCLRSPQRRGYTLTAHPSRARVRA